MTLGDINRLAIANIVLWNTAIAIGDDQTTAVMAEQSIAKRFAFRLCQE